MLSTEILNALKGYTATMQNTVSFVLQTGEYKKRDELVDFLEQISAVSENIILEQRDTNGALRSPISFYLEVDGKSTGTEFSGIPSGHEFNSLILALLWSSGTEIKLDDSLKAMVQNINEELHFEVFISLSCHNCPDFVQGLNQFALLNPNIKSEMIDGGLFPTLISDRDIQGVPSVYLNGELFANGKVEIGELVKKLIERFPVMTVLDKQEALPTQDVTVIGGGPAGVAAAVYSARKGLKVTMIAERFGGQVKDTMGIENLIGTPKTTGPELTGSLLKHLQDYDITLKEHLRVDSVEKGTIKKIKLSSGEEISTKTLVIATGARWRELNVPGEKENIGNGVAYCPHCDGPFFKGKDVAVIGGGNSGVEAALDLAGIVKSVSVFEFAPELKADKVLIDQVNKRNNITILKNVATKKIHASNGKVTAIEYQERDSGELKTHDLSGVFVQIGLIPNSQFAKDLVELSPNGEIVINEKCETSEVGIFACGDVTTVPYKQIVISMGEGSKAALTAFEYLLMNDFLNEDVSLGTKAKNLAA